MGKPDLRIKSSVKKMGLQCCCSCVSGTALHLAAWYDHLTCCELLVDVPGQFTADCNGYTPLHYAGMYLITFIIMMYLGQVLGPNAP